MLNRFYSFQFVKILHHKIENFRSQFKQKKKIRLGFQCSSKLIIFGRDHLETILFAELGLKQEIKSTQVRKQLSRNQEKKKENQHLFLPENDSYRPTIGPPSPGHHRAIGRAVIRAMGRASGGLGPGIGGPWAGHRGTMGRASGGLGPGIGGPWTGDRVGIGPEIFPIDFHSWRSKQISTIGSENWNRWQQRSMSERIYAMMISLRAPPPS